MRGEDDRGPCRHLVELVDEDRALGAQVAHDVGVVDDLVAHVDRRTELRERALDDLDRTVDAGTEAARLGEDDIHHNTPITLHFEHQWLSGQRMVEVDDDPLGIDRFENTP